MAQKGSPLFCWSLMIPRVKKRKGEFGLSSTFVLLDVKDQKQCLFKSIIETDACPSKGENVLVDRGVEQSVVPDGDILIGLPTT